MAAAGTPGREAGAVRVRRRRHHVRRVVARGDRRTGRCSGASTAADRPAAAARPAVGVYEHGVPGGTAGPGMVRGALQHRRRRRAEHRWGTAVPFGSGNRHAGRPALRQNSSGSMPRFLNAASTNGCRIWPGSRLTSMHLEVRAGRDRLGQRRGELAQRRSACRPGRTCASLRMSLIVRSCSSTWLRFGLSLMKPFTCAENCGHAAPAAC